MVPDGFSPLHAAAFVGNLSAITILLDFVQSNKVMLLSSIKSPKVSPVQISLNEYLDVRDNQGRTALHVCK